MQAVIISDVHLGNRHCRHREFVSFLHGLPEDTTLILNGDTIDHWHQHYLPGAHRSAFDSLIKESRRRTIVWLRGNNDRSFVPPAEGCFDIRTSYSFGKRLFAAHGNHFESIMPAMRPLLWGVRAVHCVYAGLTGGGRHLAEAAKKVPRAYAVLTNAVSRNAVRYAQCHGYAAVTCGHTHHAEERTVQGIRYINTGCWTEETPHCVVVKDGGVVFRPALNGAV